MNPKIMSAVALGLFAVACSSGGGSSKKPLTGAQTGSASVNLATAALSVVSPKQIKVSGTAVVDDGADTVTLSLTLKNGSKSVLHNPKLTFSAVSEGAVTGDGSFGPAPIEGGGVQYVYYGPESIAPGGEVSRDIEITGVVSTSGDLTMDLEVLVHPWIFLPFNDDGVYAVDGSGTGEELDILDAEIELLGFDGDTWMRVDAASPDSRYVYYTNRNQPAVLTFDTVAQTLTLGDSVMGGTLAFDGSGVVGCFDGLTPSPDGAYLYGTLNHGAHLSTQTSTNWPTPTMVEVLKLNAKTLNVVDRVTVWEPPVPSPGEGGGPLYDDDIRGRTVSVSTTGTYGALTVTGTQEVLLLNLDSMTVMDSWLVSGYNARQAAVNADATQIAVCYTWRDDSAGELEVIDTATDVVSALVPPTLDGGTSTYSPVLTYGPDDRLYYGRAYNGSVPGLSIYDPSGPSWVELTGVTCNALAFREDRYYLYDDSNGMLHMYDYTDAELTFPATGAAGLAVNASWGHGLVITD